MKVTINWLKDFVDIDITPEELGDKLTNAGMEIEEIIYQNEHLKNVVVGKILQIEKHPNAERLVVCQIDIGEKVVQIVTAAKNMQKGDYVPVSLPGASLCDGVKIEASKLRGIDSNGMLCGVEELGVSDYDGDKNGIMILDDSFAPGTKIEDALFMNDVILDVNVTANRPDCMSIVGIAREVCAVTSKVFKEKEYTYKVDNCTNINDLINITVKDKILCPRYIAAGIKDISIKKSPKWIRARLEAIGIKPINTLVDITNYVLIEYGQPMHAFDHKFLEEQKIIVRRAENGEKITVLNGNTYELNSSNLCICDAVKPVVIAGIIGGTNSCVSQETHTAILESAVFERANIRRTGRSIGVRTDATARYEKGVDLGSAEIGIKRALSLIDELSVGTIVSGLIDICDNKPKERTLNFSLKKIEKLLGIIVPDEKIIQILKNLGIETQISERTLTCVIPTYRMDIENDADIAEEIIRMYGYDVYDNIDKKPLSDATYTVGGHDPVLITARKLKYILCDRGYFETVNYSICSENAPDKLLISKNDELSNMIRIANPLSEDISYVRTTLANAMLNCVSYNYNHKNNNFRLFEVGRVYIPKELPLKELPHEKNMISFAQVCENEDFYNIKGVVENLLSSFNLKYTLNYSQKSFLHSGISADIIDMSNNEIIGSFGKVHPKVCSNFDIPSYTYYGEIDIDKLILLGEKMHSVKMLSKYPTIERDLAIVCDEEVRVSDLLESIKKSCGMLFYDVNLFDIYRSETLGINKKSLAFKFRIVSYEKTLTDEEVTAVFNKVIKDITYKFGAKLR